MFHRTDNVLVSYHKDAARPLVHELMSMKADYEVVGGGQCNFSQKACLRLTPGRINHQTGKGIKIYGYSIGFPWIDGVSKHDITASLMKLAYPGEKVEFSDDGY